MPLPELIDRLHRFYGVLPPPPRDPFILFVWEVLSVHSTSRKRDAALGALKRMRALTPDSLWRAPQKKLEESVALAGPYLEQRLRALRTGVEIFRRNPNLSATIRGPMIAARRALKGLPQMGEGGGYRMLLFAADHPVLPIDARVARVATRLGYGSDAGSRTPDPGARPRNFAAVARTIRLAVERELPADVSHYRRAFLYLEHHGAATCTEADPHCTVCPLLDACPEGKGRMERSAGADKRGRQESRKG